MQLRIGTRKSTLALAQVDILRGKLREAHPELGVQVVPMMTTGDKNTDRSLADIGGKALFTRELELALLDGHIDIAVHSLKDMEARLPAGLAIAAVLPREDPRDALISRDGLTLAQLPAGARIGTSSPRRAAQLALVRPDLIVQPFRGNVTTRLSKLKAGEVDATLLAVAGLRRIGRENEITEILDVYHFTPAAGQGVIAIECKEDNDAARRLLSHVHCLETYYATLAERSLLVAINGSCRTPIGAYARLEGGKMRLDAILAKPDGSAHAQVTRTGGMLEAEQLGKDAGAELLAYGARDWFA